MLFLYDLESKFFELTFRVFGVRVWGFMFNIFVQWFKAFLWFRFQGI